MITIQDMVQREVNCCMSSLVATLAGGAGAIDDASHNTPHDSAARDLRNLAEQAFELASPIPDYEEAAIQAGWSKAETGGTQNAFIDKNDGQTWCCAGWEELCNEYDIEPYDRDVFEHWAVSDWLADKLIAKGEKVDKDFAGLCIWARTTTGQAIHADGVIEEIYKAMIS